MEVKVGKNQNYPLRLISKELIDRILHDIKRGSPNKYASEANGVSESLFYTWMRQGILDSDHLVDSLYAYLVQSMRKIEQDEIISCRQDVRFCPKGHAGAQWTLEHAYWKTYGSKAENMELNERLERLESQGVNANGTENEKTS